jgi:hypothetical protein
MSYEQKQQITIDVIAGPEYRPSVSSEGEATVEALINCEQQRYIFTNFFKLIS